MESRGVVGVRRGLALAAVLLVLSGCNGPALSSDSHFDDVMRNSRATADEIIAAAGPPDEVAQDADGSLLVLWRPFIVPEGEGPELEGATAWRLYDAQGHTVRTYSSPDLEDLSLTATQQGFLLSEPNTRNDFKQAYLVDPAGKKHQVPVDPRRFATRPGDAFVAGSVVQHFYRPSDRTLHELLREPDAPRDIVQWSEALLDTQGALWIQGYDGPHHWVAWSRDGGRRLHKQTLPLEQPGGTPAQPRMVVAHGVTAVLTDQVNGDAGQSVGPRYLDVVSGYGHQTHRVTATTFPFLGRLSVDPDLSVMTDGRVLLGDRDAGQWWVATDASNLEFERLNTQKNIAFVEDLGGTLFAWGQWDHREVPLQTSTDIGRTWSRFNVSPRTG